MQISSATAREDRKALIQRAYDLFLKSEISKLEKEYSDKIGTKILVACYEDAPNKINTIYWEFIDEHVRPLLSKADNESPEKAAEKKIDLFKILSATEYSIMAVSPFFVRLEDNQPIEYGTALHENFEAAERLINANFAFKTSLALLEAWQKHEPNEPYYNSKISWDILGFKEPTVIRQNSMHIGDEHISILAFTDYSSQYPIFSNANWWRLFCLCNFLLDRGQIDLITLTKPKGGVHSRDLQ